MTTQTIVRPISDHLVVRREDAEEFSPGGVLIPEAAKEKPSRGKVVAVGSGQLMKDGTRAKMEVKEGDTVVFSTYQGTDVEIDGERMIVLRESDVLLVL